MKRLSVIILVFAVVFTGLFMAPAFLSKQLSFYPLMKAGDLLDVFTPLILIPLYWLLFRLDADKAPSLKENLLFMLVAALWVEGQGMHLAANSIGHLLKGAEGSDFYRLTNFYDEVLSHYLWHLSIIGLAALIVFRQWRNPFAEVQGISWQTISAGVIHGFTYFIIIIEGATTPLGVPFAVLLTLFGLIWGRKRFSRQPLLFFFFIASFVATLFFVGWGIYWQGLPEFSQVGIID